MIPGGATREDLRRIADNIRDALVEFEIQRGRLLEAHGPSYSEVLDLWRTISNLRADLTRIESLLTPTTPTVESLQHEEAQLESRLRVVREAEAELKRRATVKPPRLPAVGPLAPAELHQYVIYYWHTVSRDVINYWVWYYDTRLPTREEASEIVERAIKQLGGGYWELVQDWTVPSDRPVLFREEEGIGWGWEASLEESPVDLEHGYAHLRKLKIKDWLEHPEPHRPKDVTVRVELVRGRA